MGKGPAIYDINTLLQAGINPKTGLPIKLDGNLPCNLQNAILKQLRVIDEQDAVNRYVWFNLPTGINASLIERVLFYKGQGCLFYMESDGKFYFLPYALDGSIDVYGRYTGITPLPFNGSVKADDGKEKPWIVGLNKKPIYDVLLPEEINQDILYDGCVLLSDYSKQISQTVLPRQMLNDPLLSVMSECIPYMRTALQNSTGISGMKVGNEDEQSNVAAASLAIQRAALNGEKWIPIIGSVEFQELTNTPTAKSEEFLLTLQALDNYRLSLYGMDNGGLFQKKSHMLEAEQKMNTGNSGIILQDGLKQRLDFCDIANSIWGTSIYCEINETINGMDTNMDGKLGYSPEYISQPTVSPQESTEEVTE